MARTISRSRLVRGTQRTRTRDVVPGDAVAPKRRRLSANGPTRPNRSTDPAELRNRPLRYAGDPDRAPVQRQSGVRSRTRSTRALARGNMAETKETRTQTRSCATEAVELARESLRVGRAKTKVRRSLAGGDTERERAKLASVRDGRYQRKGARFIV